MALSRRWKIGLLVAGVVVVSPLWCCCPLPLDLLLSGWVPYVSGVCPDARVGWTAAAVGRAFAASAVVVHLVRLGRRGAAGPRWADSLRVVGVGALAVMAGFAMAGLCGEVVRFQTGPEPMYRPPRSVGAPLSRETLKKFGAALDGKDRWKDALPPALVQDASGRALHGWPTLLLPYVGEEELFRRIDLSQP